MRGWQEFSESKETGSSKHIIAKNPKILKDIWNTGTFMYNSDLKCVSYIV